MLELTAEYVRAVLHYAPETGLFTRLRQMSATALVGDIAGHCKASTGYWTIGLCGRYYQAHRLAFFYMTGEWPPHEVDHVDGDRANNRWANLRAATKSENLQNRSRPKKGSRSGFLGVSPRKYGRWHAEIKFGGERRHLGTFNSAELAHAAYLEAKKALHPFAPKGTE